jgi:DNA modification methylase
MHGDLAETVFTDPPYNVKINGHVSGTGQHAEFAMASGEMSSAEFTGFLELTLGNMASALADGGIAFVCMDHAHVGELLDAGEVVFDHRLNICVWDKGQGGMGALYRSQHELVAVFKKGDAPHRNNIALGKNGRNRTNVWSFPGMVGFSSSRKKALELHPTVKPVALIAEALLDVTAPGDVVLDAFGGSGSTLIAAEKTGRRARLVEFDPRYVDRIVGRWEKLTGRTAELLDRIAE